MKQWLPHRRWLIKNGVDLSIFPEEIEFKQLVARWKLIEKAEIVRMSETVTKVVHTMARKEIGEIMHKNSHIRNK